MDSSEPPDGIRPSPPSSSAEILLSSAPDDLHGLMPLSFDHYRDVACSALVPSGVPGTIVDVTIGKDVVVHRVGKMSTTFYGVSFDELPNCPVYDHVLFSSPDVLVVSVGCDESLLLGESLTWPKSFSTATFEYTSHDPLAETMFDGHFLTPEAQPYINELSGMSRFRSFLPNTGVVVWFFVAEGKKTLFLQSGSAACESDYNFVCGARVSLVSQSTFNVILVPWKGDVPPLCPFSEEPTTEFMECPPARIHWRHMLWPLFIHNGKTFCRVPPGRSRIVTLWRTFPIRFATYQPAEITYTWFEAVKAYRGLSTYLQLGGITHADVVKISVPEGNFPPHLVLQGITGPFAPGLSVNVQYQVVMSAPKETSGKAVGIVMSGNNRRFSVSSRRTIFKDPRYENRRLKSYNSPYIYVPLCTYAWKDHRDLGQVSMSQFSTPWFFQTSDSEYGVFVQWYQNYGKQFYDVVACEYWCGDSIGHGDVLLWKRDNSAYVCLEIKASKSQGVINQALKFSLVIAARALRAGLSLSVHPATLVKDRFVLYAPIKDALLSEYLLTGSFLRENIYEDYLNSLN